MKALKFYDKEGIGFELFADHERQSIMMQIVLKADGQILYQAPKIDDIGLTLNHWVHHRGQLTVYMRLNDIPVPSIYGPSADERTF